MQTTADGGSGSITGMYTILVEGDDATEPISDAARGILDGHLMLSRKLAQKGHYPAIDVLDSVSRVGDDVTDSRHRAGRVQLARVLAAYREVEDLVQIGAYASGSDPESDVAIEFHKPINPEGAEVLGMIENYVREAVLPPVLGALAQRFVVMEKRHAAGIRCLEQILDLVEQAEKATAE